ncbi:hypothetical protein ACJJTC_001570 [Scirpophaga incertulas]
MSNKIKCSSCNIVINEILAFICRYNKIDVMDEVSLSRICVSAFSNSDIVIAKQLLFETLSTAKSMKTRRREGKALRDIDDIICLVKGTDPEKLTVFVARELQKLPPVLFDHVDVTRILKDLVKMRSDINFIEEEYATKKQMEAMKIELENLKRDSRTFNCTNIINSKRGACRREGREEIKTSTTESQPPQLPSSLKQNESGGFPRTSIVNNVIAVPPAAELAGARLDHCVVTNAARQIIDVCLGTLYDSILESESSTLRLEQLLGM